MKYIIGRGNECEIKINYLKISVVHCSIQETPNGYYMIEDLDSANHTYINGTRIKIARYNPADKLVLADKEIDFKWLSGEIKHLNNDYIAEFAELKKILENHEKKLKKIDWKYSKMTLIIRIIISLLPFAVGVIFPSAPSLVRNFLYTSSGVLVTITILFQQKNPKIEAEKKQENRNFLLSYRCPKCNLEFGNRDWYLIENEKCCRNCHAKFV